MTRIDNNMDVDREADEVYVHIHEQVHVQVHVQAYILQYFFSRDHFYDMDNWHSDTGTETLILRHWH